MSLRLSFTLVGIGGAAGGLARYGLTTVLPEPPGALPWTTWTINVSGSFLLGLLVAGVVGRRGAPAWVRPAFGTGVLGGYTTFSAYAHALDVLAADGHAGTAAGYLVVSLAGGVVAAAAGVALGARLPARTVPGPGGGGGGGGAP
ncbi:fluoride efflux transporter FluC [Cellulomonas sp. NPDC055163]